MSSGPEYTLVEQPFIDQLVKMGWKYTTGNIDHASATGRESFREVLLKDDLRRALVKINRNEGGDRWLDEDRINQAITALERLGTAKPMEANQAATELLLLGTVVDGVEGWDQGRGRTVQFIDWETPENNTFRVINQFRVDEPGGQAKKYILPDLVLFINGIPVVVVEAKSPTVHEPMPEAIDQLQRYANQRSWVEDNEGNERLFHTNQFVVATSFDEARVSTFSAKAVHYLEWKDTSPKPMADVAQALGKTTLSSQEKLVAGMLTPSHLLDIIRHFTLFATFGGKRVKIVGRYQQFRAVQLATQRMLSGKTRRQDGEFDRRGGIIWHTQGSGKSLTMVFLIRKMRSLKTLRRFKIVMVTDRKDLQKQLADTAVLTGESLTVVKPRRAGTRTISSVQVLQETLRRPGKDLVFAMIQKYQTDTPELDGEDEDAMPAKVTEPFPVLNEDEGILIMVDEAHRSQGSALHANLLQSMPGCVRIGFTGTPIIMGDKKRTHQIFGEFIDKYTIKQSEADGATLPILYEGRTVRGAVADGRGLDEIFEDMFDTWSKKDLDRLKAKYATKGHVLEAPAMIVAKARDMLRHYVENILPNGFKAQVVAHSRRATIRYQEAFEIARIELVAKLVTLGPLGPDLLNVDPEHHKLNDDKRLDDEVQFLLRAHPYLDTIRGLEFAPVISGANNDDPSWKRWTDRAKLDARIVRFKKPLFHDDPNKRDGLAFLIVKSMLLTGFDAPVEQVMYLDRSIKEAELLQAIARVNRTNGETKKAGIVVDYFGVARHLKTALAAYTEEDVEGALESMKDEIPKLRDQHRRVVDILLSRGLEDITDTEGAVELLRESSVRADFKVKLKAFLSTLDLVLPRPEALPYVADAKVLAFIHARARNRYRGDERPIGQEVGAKVRKLIDDYVIAKGIDVMIPPVAITDAQFETEMNKEGSPRAKASEMEHAIRSHIRKHQGEDPEHYEKLSTRLSDILKELGEQWDDLVKALQKLVDEARAGRQTDDTGLDPETQAPFLDVLKREVGAVTDEELSRLCRITIDMVAHIQQEVRNVDFWKNAHAQEVLRKWVVGFLDEDDDLVPFARQEYVADRLLELAKANHHKLVR